MPKVIPGVNVHCIAPDGFHFDRYYLNSHASRTLPDGEERLPLTDTKGPLLTPLTFPPIEEQVELLRGNGAVEVGWPGDHRKEHETVPNRFRVPAEDLHRPG